MLTAENDTNVADLQERTRLRNSTVWIALDYGGIMAPVSAEAEMLKTLGERFIEGYIAEQEELFAVKEYQRDALIELENDKVTQDGVIADKDATTKRAILAIKLAAETYVNAAREYDALVKSQIMAAREYAEVIDEEQVGVESLRTALAVVRSENRLKEINAEIYYEYVKRQEVAVDIARAKVDASKAQVRAVMADLGVKEAELEVAEAELQEAMIVADKVTMQADIVSIFADIVTKGLSKIQYEVEKEDVAANLGYIQTKLDDLLDIWDVRQRLEELKTSNEEELYQALLLAIASDKTAVDLGKTEMTYNETLQSYQRTQTNAYLSKEQTLINDKLAASEGLASDRTQAEIDTSSKNAWAKKLVNTAQRYVDRNHCVQRTESSSDVLYVSGD